MKKPTLAVEATRAELMLEAESLLGAVEVLRGLIKRRRGEVPPALVVRLQAVSESLSREVAGLREQQGAISDSQALLKLQRDDLAWISVELAALEERGNVLQPPPPVGPVVHASHDFEDGTFGGFATFAKHAEISIVPAENGVSPASGSRMVKFVTTKGHGSGLAQVYLDLKNNPARSPTGVYIRWRMCIPLRTLQNVASVATGKDAQIKLHLFRVADQNPDKHTPLAYHGLVFATGRPAVTGDFAVAKDHLNIWVKDAANALDGSGSWTKRPKYRGGTWVECQEWYQTDDGVRSQYKLWLNQRLCKHETFDNVSGGLNRLIGGAPTDTYSIRLGMPYFVNRSGIPDGLVVYIDRVDVTDTFITD